MELRELRSLAALAEAGSLRKVADQLHLSPAAIHRQLKLLSEELGLQLYEGTRRQIRLTQAGAALCPLIQDLLLHYEAVVSAANDWRGAKKGEIRIGTGPSFGHYILPKLLEAFREQFAEVDFFVQAGHSEQLIQELLKGHLDLLFLVPSPGMKDMVVENSWEFRVVLVGDSRARRHSPCSFADLKDVPYLSYEHGTYFQTIIDRYFAHHGFAPHIAMRFNNTEPIKAMIRSGFGISMLPEWTIEEEIRSGQLELICQQEDPLIVRQAVLRRRISYQAPPVKAFLDLTKNWKGLAARRAATPPKRLRPAPVEGRL